MEDLLIAEPIGRLFPGLDCCRSFAIENIGGRTQGVALFHKGIDVADADKGIARGPARPIERKRHGLHRAALVTHLQTHPAAMLPNAPALGGGGAHRAAETRHPGFFKTDGRHGVPGGSRAHLANCAQNVRKICPIRQDKASQRR